MASEAAGALVRLERRALIIEAVLDCGGINFFGSQGAAKLVDVVDLAREAGVTPRLARLKPAARATLARDGVIERIGPDGIHGNIYRAVKAVEAAVNKGARRPAGLAA